MSRPKYKTKGKGEPYAVAIHSENLFKYLATVYNNEKYVPKRYRFVVTDKILSECEEFCAELNTALAMSPKHKKTAKKQLKHFEKAQDHYHRLLSLIQLSTRITNLNNTKELAELMTKVETAFGYTKKNAYNKKRKLPSRKEYVIRAHERWVRGQIKRQWNELEKYRDSDGFVVLIKRANNSDDEKDKFTA